MERANLPPTPLADIDEFDLAEATAAPQKHDHRRSQRSDSHRHECRTSHRKDLPESLRGLRRGTVEVANRVPALELPARKASVVQFGELNRTNSGRFDCRTSINKDAPPTSRGSAGRPSRRPSTLAFLFGGGLTTSRERKASVLQSRSSGLGLTLRAQRSGKFDCRSSCTAEAPTFRAQQKAEREAKRQQACVEAAARTWRGKRKTKSQVPLGKLDEWSRDSQLRLQLDDGGKTVDGGPDLRRGGG